MISICIIGAGNVATHLYKVFSKTKTVSVKQWYSRDISKISSFQNTVSITDKLSELIEVDLYIIAVSDDAISEISKTLPFENRLVVHTSGSVSVYDLDKKNRRGVFYPLQTFSKDVELDFKDVPICIETIGKKDYPLLESLAQAIGSNYYKVNSNQRQVLHLAAVFVNNFSNQLYRVAHELTESEGVEFDILKPLILETAKKVQNVSPYLAQTGPAKRNDKKTIKRHLTQLKTEEYKALYSLLTESIKNTHGTATSTVTKSKKISMEDKNYKEYLEHISTLIFDVDGVLTDGTITVTTSGEMLRTMNIKDGYALKTAVDKGYHVCVISGGSNEGVKLRLEGLGVTDVFLGANNKIEKLNEYLKKYQIDLKNVLFMGDDLPDFPVMKLVGLPCCPQDAVQEIKAISKYVSHKDGGKGAVRDVIEQVLKVQGKWLDNYSAQYD